MNLYKFSGMETAFVIAEDEMSAMNYLVEFLGDEIKEDGGDFKLIPKTQEIVVQEDDLSKVTKTAEEWICDGPGVLASSLF